MTTREKRIESAVEVHLFDRTDADKTGNIEYYHAQQLAKDTEYVAEEFLTMEPFDQYGYVDTPKGMYVFLTEGVGDSKPINGDDTVTMELYTRTYENAEHEGSYSFGMFPTVGLKFTADEIRERATGETVLLHEFIRKFGARLESNYHQWKRTLEAALKEVS
jgi:hypothetical protein